MRGRLGEASLPKLLLLWFVVFLETRAAAPRREFRLDEGWRTIAAETGSTAGAGFEQAQFNDESWTLVSVPHNWDAYEGFCQTRHGNRHGTAWYRRTFVVESTDLADERRVFLFFEGVGSYATVWVNGQKVGEHAGGLTTFTLDVTSAVHAAAPNVLTVRADHPAGIRDLPWVCGGCELAAGFSEGSQPFGIFRPVHVVITAPVRVAPFGVHAWNDAPVDVRAAVLHTRTKVMNHGRTAQTFSLETRVLDARGEVVAESSAPVTLAARASSTVSQDLRLQAPAQLWSPEHPYRYTLQTAVRVPGTVLDRVETPYGIRWIAWPDPNGPTDQPFRVNGQPVFINGVADYEHQLGASHAFTDEQVDTRAHQIEAAGFNAFRDAHHPHNLRFNELWDRDGLLWWAQFGAHIWFENDVFKSNYKNLLREWVRERRNSPSLVLWGLQNESKLPAAFAAECAAIIRELDPTASTQRLITTCNGGEGTDWNVAQNWSGTYGGDPFKYADELRAQRLVGEYGAWRSLGLHRDEATNVGAALAPSLVRPANLRDAASGAPTGEILSEDRMAALLETKVRLAESVHDQVAGHFVWPFTSHANPGRNFGENGEQLFDGIRELDRIGPVNNKGLLTIWGEPTDAYQMFRANYALSATQPMVYIVSHTWSDRWIEPGRKREIVVYSNCDEVELFNDLGARSLGVRSRETVAGLDEAGPGSPTPATTNQQRRGTHFQWDDVAITTNVLYAEGRVGGKTVATDITLLHHLPVAPEFAKRTANEPAIEPLAGPRTYLYRVNCGGPDYVDANGHTWLADREYSSEVALRGSAGTPDHSALVPVLPDRATSESWGSVSWAHRYPHLPPALGSQRKITDPIDGTRDDALFQTFRYGREELRYLFPVPNGDYDVELFFIEPWYLAGGGANCAGWRLFDVAINGETKLRDVDLWREAGRAHATRKVVAAHSTNGRLEISFPRVAAGQAVISAIAISTRGSVPTIASVDRGLFAGMPDGAANFRPRTHLDNGDTVYADAAATFFNLPLSLLDAEWLQPAHASTQPKAEALQFSVPAACELFVAHDVRVPSKPGWLKDWDRTELRAFTTANPTVGFEVFRRRCAPGEIVHLGTNAEDTANSSAMYVLIAKPTRPAAPATLIRDLKVSSDVNWRAVGNLQAGAAQYADRSSIFVTVPPALTDADWIRTAHAHAEDLRASFTAFENLEVHVALDTRITLRPDWMRDWIETNLTITTSDPTASRFLLWKHRFVPGETVELGPNGAQPDGSPAAMYSVVVRSVRAASRYQVSEVTPDHATWMITVGVWDPLESTCRHASLSIL